MALVKVKLADGSTIHINDTEFIGVYEGGILSAKCVPQGFDETQVLIGIAKLWSKKGYVSDAALIETEGVDLSENENVAYFHLVLISWFRMCNRAIAQGLKPLFKSKIVINQSVRGKPNFFQTELKNKGLLGPIISKLYYLTLEIPELMVIRDAYEMVLSTETYFPFDKRLRADMVHALGYGLSFLNLVPSARNVQQNALIVSNRNYDLNGFNSTLPAKLRHLSRASRFCANLILRNAVGASPEQGKSNGLLLNMNFLLEKFLKFCCQNQSSRVVDNAFSDGINKVEHGILMRPDISGGLDDGTHFILDAKHKVFVDSTGMVSASRRNRYDSEISKINRDDYYQIISYSRTHHHVDAQTLYGLVGLWVPREPLKSEYIYDEISPIVIQSRDSTGGTNYITISRIGLNFCRLLAEYGSSSDLNELYNFVGKNLFKKLRADIMPNIRSIKLNAHK